MIDKKQIQLFHNGESCEIYRWMGAHPVVEAGVSGFRFTVWAPHAVRLNVVLPDWGNNACHPLAKLTYGIWSTFVPYVCCGQ